MTKDWPKSDVHPPAVGDNAIAAVMKTVADAVLDDQTTAVS